MDLRAGRRTGAAAVGLPDRSVDVNPPFDYRAIVVW